MDKQEVQRRIELIEKHMDGDCEIQFYNADNSEWATLISIGNDYSIVLYPSVEVREKPQDIECWANVYSDHRIYHPSEKSALDNVMPGVIHIAVHMKEVVE